MKSITRARIVAATLAVGILVGMPVAASAHVKVSPNTADPGDDIALTFRVPNESETAGTTRVQIFLPTKTPFAGAEYEPVDGWTAKVIEGKLPKPIKNDGTTVTTAPTSVIFTAKDGVQIDPGQFQEFTLALDVTPTTGSVEFPTWQTYSDGTVVKWNESTPASGDEPDNPAPTLYITAPPPADEQSGVGVSATAADSGTAQTALIIGTLGLAVAVIALVLGIFAFVQSRRRPAAKPRN